MNQLTKCIFTRFSNHLLDERLGILPLQSLIQLSTYQFQFSFYLHPSLMEDFPELAEVCLMSDVECFQVCITLLDDDIKVACLAFPLEANDALDSQLHFLSKLIEVEFSEVYLPPYTTSSVGGMTL